MASLGAVVVLGCASTNTSRDESIVSNLLAEGEAVGLGECQSSLGFGAPTAFERSEVLSKHATTGVTLAYAGSNNLSLRIDFAGVVDGKPTYIDVDLGTIREVSQAQLDAVLAAAARTRSSAADDASVTDASCGYVVLRRDTNFHFAAARFVNPERTGREDVSQLFELKNRMMDLYPED